MEPLTGDDPRSVGPYRLLRRLGAGGMGRVYLGRSAGGRTVAVKVTHSQFATNDEFRARFRREVAAAQRVGDQWTAPVLGTDPEAAVPWVATGYVAGPSLSDVVADFGALPEPSVRALAAGLAEALVTVHRLGLIHRDVKPSNVLLSLNGPRLIDFGIARATDATASLTATGVSIGSPGYMSPEQIMGRQVEAASDVFSLGAVLAFAATGTRPFPGDSSAALLYRVVHEEPELGGLTGDLRDLVAACLRKTAADRPTPARVVEWLTAGAGAAGLIRTGWLPAAVVERASIQAAELLDLEAEPEEATPVAGTAPAPHPPNSRAGSSPGAPTGGFGPPHPSFVQPRPATGGDTGTAGGGDTGARAGTASGHGVAVPLAEEATGARERTGGGPDRMSAPSGASAHWSVSGDPAGRHSGAPATPPHPATVISGDAAQRAPGVGPPAPSESEVGPGPGRRRKRRLLWTSVVALLVASVVVPVAFVLLPGHHEDAPAPGPRKDVPKAFLGTWEGELTQRSGVPAGELRVTLRAGKVGAKVGHGEVRLLSLTCPSRWKLVSATSDRLVLDSRDADSPKTSGGMCTAGVKNEEFSLRSDGSLHYDSHDDRSGNVTADLRKTS